MTGFAKRILQDRSGNAAPTVEDMPWSTTVEENDIQTWDESPVRPILRPTIGEWA